MQEILQPTPSKVILEDFAYKIDLTSRLLLEQLSVSDIFILEEILYSPLKTDLEEISEISGYSIEDLEKIIVNLLPLNLFSFEDGNIRTSKERRKFFETIILKFNKKFTPSLEYYKHLIKQAPIHLLISWFHIPRTSNNVFTSLIDKHFKTPKMYRKYLEDTLSEDKELKILVDMVINANDSYLLFDDLKESLELTSMELEEKILFLEHHYILCSSYFIEGQKYIKKVEIFSEWKDWLSKNLNEKSCNSIDSSQEHLIAKQSDEEFSFILDMSKLIELSSKEKLQVSYKPREELFYLDKDFKNTGIFFNNCAKYLARVINKNLLLGLFVIENEILTATPPAKKWLETELSQRTLITFKHPHNSLSHSCNFSFKIHDRNIIEIQKALSLVTRGSWILLDVFISTYLQKANALKQPALVKTGKKWAYSTPSYDNEELTFIKVVITDWLFESGMVIPGIYKGGICFRVTTLGYELYS